MKYWLRATDRYSLHAPFIYRVFDKVIADSKEFEAFEQIEQLRQQLLHNHQKIQICDYGSGSVLSSSRSRSIASIAKHSVSKPKFSRLLFRLILTFKPKTVVEIGTSLGINTLYMAMANPAATVITMEGCPETAAIARNNFALLKASHVRLIEGNIDTTLPEVVYEADYLDFIYFDANHTKEATLRYFYLCISKARESSIFIFDDIHLSKPMNEAWEIIHNHPSVKISIDIFDAGIIFFKKGLQKKHYILEF